MLRYAFGGVLCVFAVAAMRAGLQWYWSTVVFSGVLIIFFGRRRIFGLASTGPETTLSAAMCPGTWEMRTS